MRLLCHCFCMYVMYVCTVCMYVGVYEQDLSEPAAREHHCHQQVLPECKQLISCSHTCPDECDRITQWGRPEQYRGHLLLSAPGYVVLCMYVCMYVCTGFMYRMYVIYIYKHI